MFRDRFFKQELFYNLEFIVLKTIGLDLSQGNFLTF
jgi:hypothetical protein